MALPDSATIDSSHEKSMPRLKELPRWISPAVKGSLIVHELQKKNCGVADSDKICVKRPAGTRSVEV